MAEKKDCSFFAPAATWPRLRLRAELLGRLRMFFAERGFLEVETPLLSPEVIIDRHVEPLSVDLAGKAENARAWLQTSPEAHMKRLVACGAEAIYPITRSFRGGERGRLHNLEFTIAEWYRRDDSMSDGMQLLSDLCEALLGRGPAERLSYRDAFLRHTQIDPLMAEAAQLAGLATATGVAAPAGLGDDRDDHFCNPRVGQLLRSPPAAIHDPDGDPWRCAVGRQSSAGIQHCETS